MTPVDFEVPRGACDCHVHVFGDPKKFPFAPERVYTPPGASVDDLRALQAALGFQRVVIVTPSVYGLDNSCLLDAMAAIAPARRRGIVQLDETKADDGKLAAWHALGVRGARINISPVRRPEAGLAAALAPKIVRTAAICQELGWHVDLLLPGWLIDELLPTLHGLPVEFSVAHMGLYHAKNGVAQPGFQRFLALVNDGSKRCWVKLTGIYRFSQQPGYTDVKPFAQALMALAPDRLIWGSDFPQLSFADRVGTIELYNHLGEWAPEAAMRQRVLADNPARLFGFG